MRKLFCVMTIAVAALAIMPFVVAGASADEAPPVPPLAVSPSVFEEVEEDGGLPLFVIILIVVAAVLLAIVLGFFGYKKLWPKFGSRVATLLTKKKDSDDAQ